MDCSVERTLKIIGGRWKVFIIHELLVDEKRFCELQRAVDGITQKMLTQQLRELERDGVVDRKVFSQVPPKVEYSLTELGRSLSSVLDAMHDWGLKHKKEVGISRSARQVRSIDPGR